MALRTVERLIKKYGGEATLDEVLERLKNPRRGRPPSWGDTFKVWWGVEAIRATGRSATTARAEYARFAKLSKTIVERRHAQGERWWGGYIDNASGGGRQTYVAAYLAQARDLLRFIARLPTRKTR